LPALRLERQTYLARSLRRQRPDLVITCDSPGHEAFDLGTDRLRPLLEAVDAILPGAEDIARRGRAHDPVTIARRFIRLGARSVVLKLGSAGSLVLAADGSAWQVPALPVALVDPTGAGDAFCGGFLAGLVATGDPLAAAGWGSASASFAIEARGPRLVPVDRPEAIRRRDAVARAATALVLNVKEKR
jgi:ribokinase